MKIYLAARYTRRLELCGYQAELEAMGFQITSRWLNGSHQISNGGLPLDAGELMVESGDQCATHFAQEDLADVFAADVVIAFTEQPRSGHSRGGRHVELGLALAKGKHVFIVGPRENVFCWLPEVLWFPDWSSCVQSLQIPFEPWQPEYTGVINELSALCHDANKNWWLDLDTGEPKARNIGELLMLCVSELAEAMEGHRKSLPDDKLPHRPMVQVELADCLIRIFDLAGGMGYDLGGAFTDKMEYNRNRADHKIENRKQAGGKAY